MDWMSELRPSRIALVDLKPHQLRIPSYSFLRVLATVFIVNGNLEAIGQGEGMRQAGRWTCTAQGSTVSPSRRHPSPAIPPCPAGTICAWAVSCTSFAIAATLIPKSAITYHLRLKERCEVRLRPHLSGHPCGMHTVFGAVGPGYGAVHDRLVLPDVEMPQGPLARIVGAAHPVAYGALERLALPVGHPHMELILRSLALLKPDIAELPLVPKPSGTS